LDILRIQAELHELNKWRQQAISSDNEALIYYGSLLVKYYRRLETLCAALSVPIPIGPPIVLFDERVPAPSAQAEDVVKKRLQQV
jgi:hypothetical protein